MIKGIEILDHEKFKRDVQNNGKDLQGALHITRDLSFKEIVVPSRVHHFVFARSSKSRIILRNAFTSQDLEQSREIAIVYSAVRSVRLERLGGSECECRD